MLKLIGIGALGTMLSPAAYHLQKERGKGHFVRVLDRNPTNQAYQQRREAWLAHGAQLVSSYAELLSPADFDGIIICAGKNGDDATIISQLIPLISHYFPKDKRPFILQCSTVSINFVKSAYAACLQKNIQYANYPLTGGEKGAKLANMLILASGDEQLFYRLEPSLRCLGQPKYFGSDIDAATKVKLIGHIMVFNGLLGISSAVALQTHSLPLSMSQEDFFDFLNQGAGGTRQWDVALKQGVSRDDWQAGFLLPHAIIDAIYTADLLIQYQMPTFTIIPILHLAATFGFLFQKISDKAATQVILKALLEMPEELEQFISVCEAKNPQVFLQNIMTTLSKELANKVKLDISINDFLGE